MQTTKSSSSDHIFICKVAEMEIFTFSLWIPKAHGSVDRENPMKNFSSINSRWVVETTVKIWEISGREEFFWVRLKMADRDIQVFHPLDYCNTLI